jgi:LuxR family maltose regulon positive regulatory protein
LLSAPAGYGKTTLLLDWINSVQHPVAWISLDTHDNDPARFLCYFIAALQQIDSNIGVDIQDALEASQKPPRATLVALLINEIIASPRRFIVVLDDCHLITTPPTYDILGFLLDNMPSNLHLLLSGRVDPSLSLSRMRAHGKLTEIRSDDLRFSVQEASTFLNDLMRLDLSIEDVKALETRTEGWIAGLQLAALSLQRRQKKHEFVTAFSGSHHYIIDYLLDEVMALQSQETQTFLLRTSILDRFCTSLCDAVVKTTTSWQIIRYLEEANIFLIPLDDKRSWYRYHHLFADSLEQWLREREPDIIPELHFRAARWHERNGSLDEAMRHALAGNLPEVAADLIESNGMHLLERSELAKLLKWVNELPGGLVSQRPWLCIYQAWALRLTGAPLESVESHLVAAERFVQERGWTDPPVESRLPLEASRMLGHLAAIRAYQALYQEEFPLAMELARQALNHRPEGSFVRSSIALALGWAYRFSGDLAAAITAFADAREVGLASGNTYLAVAATCRAAHAQALGGQLHQAVATYREAVELATQEDGRHLPVAGYALVYLGGIHREWGDLETAERHLMEGITLCERVGYLMDQVVGHVNLARVRQAQGDWAAAHEAIANGDRLSQMMKQYVYVRRWVEDCQVRFWLAQKDLDSAARWAEGSQLAVDDELAFSRELEHLILARVLVALGREQPHGPKNRDALMLLGRLLEMAKMADWRGKIIEISVLQALALESQGQTDWALAALHRALSTAAPEGYVRTFVDEGKPLESLLSLAANRGVMTDYASKVLAAFKPLGAGGQASDHPLLEPLSRRELEVLRLLATDLSGPEIARELTIALTTLRFHTRNIYGKLDVSSRRGAVQRARDLGLV